MAASLCAQGQPDRADMMYRRTVQVSGVRWDPFFLVSLSLECRAVFETLPYKDVGWGRRRVGGL